MSAHNAKYNSPEWIGKQYGKLTVVGLDNVQFKHGKKNMWVCKCECGKTKTMEPGNVLSGHSTTCGCGKTFHWATKHGESSSRLYSIWGKMCERCSTTTKEMHKDYAGRGIRLCDEWKKYENFAAWAMKNGYSNGLSIERVNNNGNYCPENCIWIDRGLQARNRRTTHWVKYQGREMSLAEACEIAGMPYKQVFSRIKYAKWPIDDALTIPINETRKWKRSERFCKRDADK